MASSVVAPEISHQPAHLRHEARGLPGRGAFVRSDRSWHGHIETVTVAAGGGRRAARPRARRAHRGAVAHAPQGADPRRRGRDRRRARSAIPAIASTPARRSPSRCRRRSRPSPEARAIPLDIVYEDDDIIVIDKPAGLVVHPAAGHATGTLVNALIAHCGDSLSGIGGVKRPGIVHRLDKDTSGLMVVAKTDRAHQALAAQFADHGRTGPLERGYLAFVWGAPDRPQGTIDAPIDRHPHARDKMAVRGRAGARPSPIGRCWNAIPAPTASRSPAWSTAGWRPAAPTRSACIWPISATRCWATPSTAPASRPRPPISPPGRREALTALGRQALHAYLLGFEHPISGEVLAFRSELPADLARLRHELAA